MHTLTFSELETAVLNFLTAISPYDGFVEKFFLDQYNMGCRWIELYEVSRWSYIGDDNYLLDTAKDSANREIHSSFLSDTLKAMIDSGVEKNNYCRYDKMTRIFNKYFIYPDVAVGAKDVSTHIFRYYYAKFYHNAGFSDEFIQYLLGEIDIKNARTYIYADITTDRL